MMRVLLIIWLGLVAMATGLQAHEVRPAIGDLTVADGQVTLDLTLNAEAVVAGVNLDGVEDTNQTEGSDAVDALRALEPDALKARIEEKMSQIIAGLDVRIDGAPVALSATDINVDPVGNTDLPRDTMITLSGEAPAGASVLEMQWPAEYGNLILRKGVIPA